MQAAVVSGLLLASKHRALQMILMPCEHLIGGISISLCKGAYHPTLSLTWSPGERISLLKNQYAGKQQDCICRVGGPEESLPQYLLSGCQDTLLWHLPQGSVSTLPSQLWWPLMCLCNLVYS